MAEDTPDPTPQAAAPPPQQPPPRRSLGERRLAAILFTDVVSFSARVQANESLTLRLVRRDFDAMKQACAANGGQVLKTTGDGLLMSFPTAGAAVACALRVQKTLARAAEALPPEQVLQHRMGIHLGDVFVGDGDVMGNDVNIAARVLSEAGGGEICVSQTVYDVVKHRLTVKGVYLGHRDLKNIKEPVPVYRLPVGGGDLAGGGDTSSAVTAPAPGPPPAPRPGTRVPPAALAAAVAAVVLIAGAIAWVVFNHPADTAATPTTQPDGSPGAVARAADMREAGGDWHGTVGSTAALVFGDSPSMLPDGGPLAVPLEIGAPPLRVTFGGCALMAPAVFQDKDHPPPPAALQRTARGDRVVGALIGETIRARMTFPDDKVRRVTVYAWDWRSAGRVQTIEVVDPRTQAVLATRMMGGFTAGKYYSFDVSGDVELTAKRTAGPNAIVSGIFIDPVPANAGASADGDDDINWTVRLGGGKKGGPRKPGRHK